MKYPIRYSLMTCLFCALSASVSHASILFHVTMNTSGLTGAGPYSIDFQLNDGGNAVNNTVTISNFTFGGGAPVGSPTLVGGASGSLSGTVAITDSSFLNEFTQDFNPGATLDFDVQLTTNVDPMAAAPDQFSFAIFDNGIEIPTNDPNLTNTFILINIDTPFPTINTATSTDPNNPVPQPQITFPPAQNVPEPTTLVLLAVGLGSLAVVMRRKKK